MLKQSELDELGRSVVEHVLGRDKVRRIAVEARNDSMDEPAYFFDVEIALGVEPPLKSMDRVRVGLALSQSLGDRGDNAFPYVQFLTPKDWVTRHGA